MHEPLKPGAIKKIEAHQFERQAEDHYCEPVWVDDVLFRNEAFFGPVHDPAAGFGRIPAAARRAGHQATGSDIVHRGFEGVRIENFLDLASGRRFQNIVTNPPFDKIEEFAEQACRVTDGKVAIISPIRRLPAAGSWLSRLPLIQVWFLTPRPSMPPGHVVMAYAAKGKEPGGGKEDFCWLVFETHPARRTARITASVGWLHRDKGRL